MHVQCATTAFCDETPCCIMKTNCNSLDVCLDSTGAHMLRGWTITDINITYDMYVLELTEDIHIFHSSLYEQV